MAVRLPIAIALGGLVAFFMYGWRKIAFRDRCPICGNAHIDRTNRPPWMRNRLGFLPLKAYHCTNCNHYFYRIKK